MTLIEAGRAIDRSHESADPPLLGPLDLEDQLLNRARSEHEPTQTTTPGDTGIGTGTAFPIRPGLIAFRVTVTAARRVNPRDPTGQHLGRIYIGGGHALEHAGLVPGQPALIAAALATHSHSAANMPSAHIPDQNEEGLEIFIYQHDGGGWRHTSTSVTSSDTLKHLRSLANRALQDGRAVDYTDPAGPIDLGVSTNANVGEEDLLTRVRREVRNGDIAHAPTGKITFPATTTSRDLLQNLTYADSNGHSCSPEKKLRVLIWTVSWAGFWRSNAMRHSPSLSGIRLFRRRLGNGSARPKSCSEDPFRLAACRPSLRDRCST
ncbi:hypothetical protein SAMN05892883_4269 [Jatrophihabitans sp. GAS493]|uniref:hypothetical protein n=1 Tax=Jatrophihabitans sp. GAS493 TaxID=1907575 RepID=UPI000BC06398|nr:hypothetical protein [Jatrophihabitans sp. GAS493]SOD75066.1 hypothetical protein SAMN05892883_4269 [Jatrophihabitans sp. GAS493]